MLSIFFFFFNDTATTEIYTLSLHDALPIYGRQARIADVAGEHLRFGKRCRRVRHAEADPLIVSVTRAVAGGRDDRLADQGRRKPRIAGLDQRRYPCDQRACRAGPAHLPVLAIATLCRDIDARRTDLHGKVVA